MGALFLHEGAVKNFFYQCNLETFLGNKIDVIDMTFVCIHDLQELCLECDRVVLFVYDIFISGSKSQVYGMLHRVFLN